MHTYKIPTYKLENFDKNFKKLQRIAKKLGQAIPSYKENGREFIKIEFQARWNTPIKKFKYEVAIIEVESEDIRIPGGWELLGIIDITTGIIRDLPNREVPEKYRKIATENICDHCNHNRRRKDTFILKNTLGETKRVGRQCLLQFCGIDGNDLATYAECISMSVFEDVSEDDLMGDVGRVSLQIDIKDFLMATIICIKKYGWVSKKTAEEKMCVPTSDLLNLWFFAPDLCKKQDINLFIGEKELEEIGKQVDQVIQYMLDLNPTSNYEHNLKQIVELGNIHPKYFGYGASIIPYWEKNKKGGESTNKIKSQHIGKEKEKLILKGVEVVKQLYINTPYGVSTLITFNYTGNILEWFASGSLDWEGYKGDIKATIKKHNYFNDQNETLITRVTKIE